mgnify:CR=1 FL=1
MGLIGEWRALRRLRKLPASERAIVFYSEGPEYWVHYQPIVGHLTGVMGRRVCYVSSSPRDPGLHQNDPLIRPFDIGKGLVRTIFFKVLDGGVLVLTMTDLGNLYIRRSALPVHFAYVYHSLVSTHMIYRTRAFEHYDSILCCGPHHVAELRQTEALYGLSETPLFEHGYGRLDSILAARGEKPRPAAGEGGQKRILVAPSWGPRGLFESGLGETLVDRLLEAGFQVTVRPHPQTLILDRDCLTRLVGRFDGHPGFADEEDVGPEDSLHAADLMVSDWSGAGLEFAFALERPVLFIDVPRKVNNPDYERLENVPIEVALREELGAVVAPERIGDAPRMADELLAAGDRYAEQARRLREKWVYNVGESGARGAEILAQLADGLENR